jgi:hypothetical protein
MLGPASGPEWTRDGAFCLNLQVLGPAPLTASSSGMGIYETLLIVSVLLILFVAREMSEGRAGLPQNPRIVRRISQALLAVLAFVALGLLYAACHAR